MPRSVCRRSGAMTAAEWSSCSWKVASTGRGLKASPCRGSPRPLFRTCFGGATRWTPRSGSSTYGTGRGGCTARCLELFLCPKGVLMMQGKLNCARMGVFCLRTLVLLALVCGVSGPIRAADAPDANAVIDKAVKAMGGEEKLSKANALSWAAKGKRNFNGNESEFMLHAVVQGLDHFRQEQESERGKGVTVLAGNKGWRKFGDNQNEFDEEALANQKRQTYLTVVPMTILPLKDKAFKVETIGTQDVDGKPAVGLKVTGPDGKDFNLFFDAASGLPVRLVAKVAGFNGDEYMRETTFSDYKEMDGIQVATKQVSKRDGEKFQDFQLTEF